MGGWIGGLVGSYVDWHVIRTGGVGFGFSIWVWVWAGIGVGWDDDAAGSCKRHVAGDSRRFGREVVKMGEEQ